MVANKNVAKSSDVVTLQNKEIKPQRRTADEWVELEILIVANENSAQYFKDEYGDTTLEEVVKRNKNKDMYPLFFAIHLGQVLCSNGL